MDSDDSYSQREVVWDWDVLILIMSKVEIRIILFQIRDMEEQMFSKNQNIKAEQPIWIGNIPQESNFIQYDVLNSQPSTTCINFGLCSFLRFCIVFPSFRKQRGLRDGERSISGSIFLYYLLQVDQHFMLVQDIDSRKFSNYRPLI